MKLETINVTRPSLNLRFDRRNFSKMSGYFIHRSQFTTQRLVFLLVFDIDIFGVDHVFVRCVRVAAAGTGR